MVGVKHLVSLISSLVQLVLEIAIAEIVKIEDTINADLVIAFFALVEFHLLPLFVCRWISPS